MKLLHVLKSEPDERTAKLIDLLSEGQEATCFRLYEGGVDYGKLIDLLFEHEKVICW
jgi:hypothetical protein